jgi:hypothetical protein
MYFQVKHTEISKSFSISESEPTEEERFLRLSMAMPIQICVLSRAESFIMQNGRPVDGYGEKYYYQKKKNYFRVFLIRGDIFSGVESYPAKVAFESECFA